MRDYSIILAADLPFPQDVLSIVGKVKGIVDGIKLAAATVLEAGKSFIAQVRDLAPDRPILIDLKIADIGFISSGIWDGTNAKIVRSLANSGATHVTVHGFPGPLSIAEAVNAAKEAGIGVLLLPLMSHAGAGLFFGRPIQHSTVISETKRAGLDITFPDPSPCEDVTDAILLLGEALDVDGYIGPATRPNDLQRYRAVTGKRIWCPGFGRQDQLGRTLEQQLLEWAQVVGPRSAAIVGSIIFKADDPSAAAHEIVELRNRVEQIRVYGSG